MPRTVFRNFDLTINRIEDDSYEVSVSSECGGNAHATFTLSELEDDVTFAAEHKHISQGTETPSLDPLDVEEISPIDTIPPALKEAGSLGGRLFNAICKDDVRVALLSCLNTRKSEEAPLRIRLNLTKVPNLATLPWEFLRIEPERTFFTRSYNSMVRYLELKKPFDDSLLLKEPPLRILVVVSNPKGTAKLDVEGEVERLKKAVKKLQTKQRIVLDVLDRPTLKAIRTRLHERRKVAAPYHIIHFVGHAVFDHTAQDGKLVLENESGEESHVSAQELGEILSRFPSLRLIVVNACEGACTSPRDVYSGVAQTFLRVGAAPAVIAMQYRISDDAAKIFTEAFYEELMNGEDIDSAIAVARMSISDSILDDGPVEWATPVLYMRAKDSRLIDFGEAETASSQTELRESVQVYSPQDDHYQEIADVLLSGNLVPFLGLDVNLYEPRVAPGPPAYAELVHHVTQFGKYPPTACAPLAGVSQYAQLPDRLTELYDHLGPLLDNGKYEPSPLHKFWARVAKELTQDRKDLDPKRRQFVVVTMNYDELLERAFANVVEQFHVFSYIADGADHERGRFFRIFYKDGRANDPFLADVSDKLSDELPVILKLPGSIKSFNARVRLAITEDQYYALLTNRDLMSILPSEVMNKLRGCHHLFLGCNITDWNTRGMLYRIWEGTKRLRRSWVVQQQSSSEIERKYWEACGVQVIDENLANYFAKLDARLHV